MTRIRRLLLVLSALAVLTFSRSEATTATCLQGCANQWWACDDAGINSNSCSINYNTCKQFCGGYGGG
jgi:hypothetical protein